MLRIRWYHFYFLLALFDVVVIMSSLHLHNKTIEHVGELLGSTARLDERSRWLNLARQRVLELNAPGNDIFQAKTQNDYATLNRRLEMAKTNMSALLDSTDATELEMEGVRVEVNGMVAAADGIFDDFRPMSQSVLAQEQRQAILLKAGPKMSEMDRQQHRALRVLGILISKNGDERNLLVQSLAVELQARANYQRYFIAAVILILVGVLAFGRRLQRSEQALAEERRRVQEERRERLAAIGELSSSVAHGIRNPLAAMCSSVELTLELADLDPKSANRLKATLREGERLGDRISGLLDVARLNPEVNDRVNLSEVVLRAAQELRPEASRRGIALEHHAPESDIIITGDRRSLELAIIELLSNAMEHSQPGDTVRLACVPNLANGCVAVSVEDQGPGVPEEVRSRVFDIFFTTKPHGTGIGLATVKRISRLHGGDVTVSASPGGGSRFTLTLPKRLEA